MTAAVGRGGELVTINLHLFGLTDTQTDEMFGLIARNMGNFDTSTSLLLGDFNFSARGEARMSRDDARRLACNNRACDMFDRRLGHLAGLYRPEYTHRTLAHSEFISFARLDRIYVSLPTAVLLDFCPLTDVLWGATDPDRPSDHVPVFTRLRKRRILADRPPRIPSWMASHPMLPQYVAEIKGRVGVVRDDPFESIDDYKVLFRLAATMVKRISVIRGARTTNEKLHWSDFHW